MFSIVMKRSNFEERVGKITPKFVFKIEPHGVVQMNTHFYNILNHLFSLKKT